MKRNMVILFTLVVAAAFLVGCGTGDPMDLSSYRKVSKADPINSSIAVAPFTVGKRLLPGAYQYNVNPDLSGYQYGMTEAMKGYSCFQKVVSLGANVGESDAERLMTAAEMNCDFLMKLTFDTLQISYKGTNGAHIPNCALWFFLEFMSWFVADEVYSGEIAGTVEILDVAEGKPVFTKAFQKYVECDLNDFQRGWQIWGIIRVPGSLDRDSWEMIGQEVLPHAFRDLEADLIVDLKNNSTRFIKARPVDGPDKPPVEPDKPDKPDTPDKPDKPDTLVEPDKPEPPKEVKPEDYALVIGVSKYKNPEVKALEFATLDANNYIELLKKSSLNLPGENVVKLTDSNATREKIEKALSDLVAKSKKALSGVYVYFSGYGASGGKDGQDKYLLPHDADPKNLDKTAINLSSFVNELSRVKTENVFFVTDAGFAATGGGKSLKTGTVDSNFTEKQLLQFLNFPGVILFGAKGAETASELPGEKNGLFTSTLLQALSDDVADENTDGKVSVGELRNYLFDEVTMQARLLRSAQSPEVHGKGIEKVRLPVVK